jgi:hypothetical protein
MIGFLILPPISQEYKNLPSLLFLIQKQCITKIRFSTTYTFILGFIMARKSKIKPLIFSHKID